MAAEIDPVCGMKVDTQKAAAQSTHDGKSYSFCSSGCKTKFDANPKNYASKAASELRATKA